MLAVGLGAGVLQSHADGTAPEAAPGEAALGTQQPETIAPAADAASETPSTVTATDTSTTAATTTGTGTPAAPATPDPATQPDPAAAAAAEAPAEQPAAPAEQAAAPAEQAPAPADAAAPAEPVQEDPAAAAEPKVRDAKGSKQDDPAADDKKKDAPAKKKAKRKGASTKTKKLPVVHIDRTPVTPPLRTPGGVPTLANPSTSIATPGPAAIGVPNFFIEKFRIPPFLLPIYQAAGTQYGIRWEVLAGINEIETDYGRNLNVSSAGAVGWMQFMPATWKQYGVDANGDGRKDPYNPVDAIFAAARYLKAAGADEDLRRAIFAYNHADWYVDSVLMRARIVGGMPADLVGSLTGLTEGRFPVAAKARYADDLDEKRATKRVAAGENAAVPVEGDEQRTGVLIFSKPGAAVVATHDGKVVSRGVSDRLGRYIRVRDTYGNTYTYARLATLEQTYPVAKRGVKPTLPATTPTTEAASPEGAPGKERLFAHPRRPEAFQSGGEHQVDAPAPTGKADYVRTLLHVKPDQVTWKRLKPGSTIVGGTVLGHIGDTSSTRAPHMLFEIRPAGRGAPRVDPKPILDGWKLLESTAIYRSARKNPFFGDDAKAPTVGQILLMSKTALQRRVLKNPNISIYSCGRRDVMTGVIDRRVLALLEFLAANGLRPTVSSLQCGHGYLTASGNVSEHSTGTALDIAAINGIPIIGHQGSGSITDITIRRLLTLQGAMKPHQIISLMTYPNSDNTLSMADHADHIHVGYRPVGGQSGKFTTVLKPGQWLKVIDRLNDIKNPVVRTTPSKASIKVTPKKYGNAGRRASSHD